MVGAFLVAPSLLVVPFSVVAPSVDMYLLEPQNCWNPVGPTMAHLLEPSRFPASAVVATSAEVSLLKLKRSLASLAVVTSVVAPAVL